jgi:ABC-type transport system involved in multi-copper enzyme maturation permease subunit
MLFVSAGMVGGIIIAFAGDPERALGSATFSFGRSIVYEVMNIYGIKMAGVFMIVTSTLALRTGFLARWLAILGYALALALVLASRSVEWILALFPLWVLAISLYILYDNLRPAASS